MPSLLSMAPGASQGLDDFLTRMLLEEKQKAGIASDQAHLAETSRHNLASEDLMGRQHQLQSMDTQARIRESEAAHADSRANQVATQGRALAEDIPSGTVLPETDPAVGKMQDAGVGGLLRGVKARPSVDVGPLQPDDSGQAIPVDSMIKLKSFTQQDKADTGAERTANQEATLTERTRHNKAIENKPPAPDRVLIQTPEGYQRRSDATATLAGGGHVDVPDTGQTKNRRDMAGSVGSHFQETSDLLDDADRRGLLGPMRGRTFAEFMAGKVGSTGNAEDDSLLGDLRMSLSMLRSGTASLHGRTGANAGIAKEIERKMDEGFMDPNQIRGGLKSLKSWVDTYAKKPGAASTGAADLVFDPATGTFKKP